MDENAYITAIDMAGEIASRENVYVTGGRKPIQVVEGVDYLVKGELIEDRGGVKLYRVADYIDRTEKDKIRTMIESPRFAIALESYGDDTKQFVGDV
jgi:mannose-1-phosphate guanylyltransferase